MRGATLLEALLVVAVLIILGALTVGAFSRHNEEQVLRGTVERTLALLTDAKQRSLAGRADTNWGIHIESDKIVLFRGDTYPAGLATNEELLLPSRVSIGTITLNGGGADIVFSRLLGTTDQHGTFVITLSGETSRSKTITVEASGISYESS